MKPNHFFAHSIALLVLVSTGCDTAAQDDADDTVARAHFPASHAVPADVDDGPDLPLAPCGNGVPDDGEECDDGWLNGHDRECTPACTFNDCELDEDGVCIASPHWPAADVGLFPCADGHELAGCTGGLGGS